MINKLQPLLQKKTLALDQPLRYLFYLKHKVSNIELNFTYFLRNPLRQKNRT